MTTGALLTEKIKDTPLDILKKMIELLPNT